MYPVSIQAEEIFMEGVAPQRRGAGSASQFPAHAGRTGRLRPLTAFISYCAAVLLVLCISLPCVAGSITYVVAVNASPAGNNATGTIFGTGASVGLGSCYTFGPEGPGFFEVSPVVPDGGIGPCDYFGGQITGSTPVSQTFSVTASTNGTVTGTVNGSVSASASAAPSAQVVKGQNVTGLYSLQAAAAEATVNPVVGSTDYYNAGAQAIGDDPNWYLTAPGYSQGAGLAGVFEWALTVNASATAPDGYFFVELGMADAGTTNDVISYDGSYDGMAGPSGGGYYPATGFTAGIGSLSGTGVGENTYDPLSVPVATTVDMQAGLNVFATENASVDPSAALIGVEFYAGSGQVTDFTLTTSYGVFTDNGQPGFTGFTPFSSESPEPSTWLLCLIGLALVAAGVVPRWGSSARAPGQVRGDGLLE